MAEDFSIKATISADTSDFSSGINNAKSAGKSFSQSISGMIQQLGKSGLVGSLGAVGLATGGVTAVLGVAKKAFQAVAKAVNECAEAYKKQYKAEVALETAVKNNPYVDGSAARGLKEFASEIQRTSDLGDEEIIPMMTQLIATGRSEAETMQIISAATDMSAAGVMSFDSAVTQLNATMNGNIGRLGQQNAELKELTEEELKNGKAVEILAGKYKGIASATADSSKQLRNAVGDLKENLGEVFNKALSPMRKFFAELVTKVNDSIKHSKDLKKAYSDVFKSDGLNLDAETESLMAALEVRKKALEEEQSRYDAYLKRFGKMINVETDRGAQEHLSYIEKAKKEIEELEAKIKQRQDEAKTKADEQARIQKQKDDEQALIKLKEDYLKKIAEQEQKWKNIEKITGEEVTNAEKLQFYQDQLVAIMSESGGKITENNQYYKDQMAIIDELRNKETAEAEKQARVEATWNDKLLAQKIENLEKAREEARKNDLLEWEERLEIDSQYGDEILDLRIKQIEKEREESLNQEGITEETRKKIILYYENEITQAKADEEEKRLKRKKETNEEEVEEEKLKFSQMLTVASQYTKKMGEVFKKVATVIKSAFSKIGNFFKKMFEFNIDDALNSLLEFEDKILTFFTSTLPNLPSFFESAIGSITHLIDQLISILDFDQIASVLSSIINSVVGLVDKITKTISADPKKLTDGIVNMLKAVIDGVSNWLTNGGFKTLLDAILTIQKALEEAVIQNLPTLVDSIIDALPDLIDFFVESIKSATRTVGKIIKPLIKLILSLIFAIVELLNDQSVIDELVDALPEIIKGIIEAIIEMLPKLLSDVLPKVLKMVLRTLFTLIPELVDGIIEGLIQAFIETDWGEVIWKMFKGFVDGIKNFFGIHSPSTMFADFGKNMIQGLWNGIKNLGNWLGSNIKKFFSKMVDGIKDCFKNIGNWFKDIFSKAWSGIKEAWGNVTNWFGDIANGIGSAFESLGSWLKGIFEKIGEWVKDAMSKVGDFFKTYGKDIGLNIATGGFYGIGKAINLWATGTNDAPKGLSIVGEAGPELVNFKGGERVYNATNTEKILAGANKGGSVFNVTFNNTKDTTAYGMMTQLKLYQRNLAFNGVL